MDLESQQKRFGNWQRGAVRYRIFARISTSTGNVISNHSFVWARMPRQGASSSARFSRTIFSTFLGAI
jgi:hypothetical protein